MVNRYGITCETESATLPHGTMPSAIMALPEVQTLIHNVNADTIQFIANVCGTELSAIDLNDTTITNILKAVQDVLNKSNTGLHIIRPNVISRVGYRKRI